MALTSAQIAKQTEVLAGVRAAFNAAVVPVAAALNALPQNAVLASAIAAWNNIVAVMNAGNSAAIRAALDATAAMVPSDPPVNTPPWFKPDLSSDAAIQAVFANASRFWGTSATINRPPVYVNGLLEVPIMAPLNAGPGIGGTGISWQWFMPQTPAPANELWAEYDFVIGTDVAAGITEAGVKLPGIAAAWEQSGQWAEAAAYGWFSCRLWHRAPNAQGLCELAGYVYSARQMDLDKLPNAGENRIIPTGKMLTPGVKYKLGQHLKYNTQAADGSWNSDGILEILCDGVVVFSDKAYKLRGDSRAVFQSFFANIFHGGSNPPNGRITYYLGNIVVDNKPIPWKPVIDMGGIPAWRKGLPIGQWVDIPNTAAAKTLPAMRAFFDGSFSGVASDRVNSVVYLPASAGHQVSDDNHVAAIDLMQDAPAWRLLRDTSGAFAGSPNAAYFPDGRPTGAHLYYSGQVVQIGGKPVVIRTLNTAASYIALTTPQHTDAFHPDRNDWDYNGTGWGTFQTQWKDNAVALDARTGRIYVQTQGGETGMLDTATGKWTQGFASNGWGYGWGGSVVDPVLDELLYDFGGYRHGGDFFEGLHLTRNVRINHPYTWQGTPCRSADQYRGMVIDEIGRAIYLVASGGDPAFFNKLDLTTWTMTNLGTVPQPNTVYNRIEHFPKLGGIAHFPAHGSNMRFYALA